MELESRSTGDAVLDGMCPQEGILGQQVNFLDLFHPSDVLEPVAEGGLDA